MQQLHSAALQHGPMQFWLTRTNAEKLLSRSETRSLLSSSGTPSEGRHLKHSSYRNIKVSESKDSFFSKSLIDKHWSSACPPRVCPGSGRCWCRRCSGANTSLLCFNWFINSVLFQRECFLLSDGQMATWGPPPPANMSPSRAGCSSYLVQWRHQTVSVYILSTCVFCLRELFVANL